VREGSNNLRESGHFIDITDGIPTGLGYPVGVRIGWLILTIGLFGPSEEEIPLILVDVFRQSNRHLNREK
jgi:hypothetical protein